MKITLGFSPCPNDTFIFDGIASKKIDTGDLEFDIVLEDVQTLNEWAIQGKLDVTKLSYGVLPLVLDKYKLLNSGSALGNGVGPLLISNKLHDATNIEDYTIAIPGENTTAHLLFSMAYPSAKNKVYLRYDEIEDFVINNKGLGVIIHENRFTYQQKGLIKITDLGDFWEKQTGNPIPLGGITIKKEIDIATQKMVDDVIRRSIQYSYSQYPQLSDYIKAHAQEMSEDVMRKHIDLYVNDYSIDLGTGGKNAIKKLLDVYAATKNTRIDNNSIFVS